MPRIVVMPAGESPVEWTMPDGGPEFEWIQEMVDGFVEVVRLTNGDQLWFNEDGKARPDFQVNDAATRLAHEAGAVPWDMVVGPAILTGPGDPPNVRDARTEVTG